VIILRGEIEQAGEWRLEELTRCELLVPEHEADLSFSCICRGAIVLTYAHWEGYFNEATRVLFREIRNSPPAIGNLPLSAYCLVSRGEIDRLIGRNASDDSVFEFLASLQHKAHQALSFDEKIVMSRSNLDWERLTIIFNIYGVSWTPFERERIYIQHQLAGLRHAIAHGTDPTLKRSQVKNHLQKGKLLLGEIPPFFEQVFSVIAK
jgi:hypothetical protein